MFPGPLASCIYTEHFLGVMIVKAPDLKKFLSTKIGTGSSCEKAEPVMSEDTMSPIGSTAHMHMFEGGGTQDLW